MDEKHGLLIVDDEHDIVDQLYDYFRRDYTVHKAYSGEEAVNLFKENEIQLVMTDQRMPKMQGTELLEMCKEKKPEVTRILMTGYTDLEVAIEAINKGSIHRYLSKPLNFEELKGIIKEGLGFYSEATKVRNLIAQEKEDIIGKVKSILSKVKNAEVDKGKLEKELQAAKEVETKIQEEMENKINALEKEKASTMSETNDLNEKVAKMGNSIEKAQAEAEKANQLKNENRKIQEELKDIESKFALANKSASSFKAEVGKIQQERDTATAEKNRMEKKLKQFQANWSKAVGR